MLCVRACVVHSTVNKVWFLMDVRHQYLKWLYSGGLAPKYMHSAYIQSAKFRNYLTKFANMHPLSCCNCHCIHLRNTQIILWQYKPCNCHVQSFHYLLVLSIKIPPITSFLTSMHVCMHISISTLWKCVLIFSYNNKV